MVESVTLNYSYFETAHDKNYLFIISNDLGFTGKMSSPCETPSAFSSTQFLFADPSVFRNVFVDVGMRIRFEIVTYAAVWIV